MTLGSIFWCLIVLTLSTLLLVGCQKQSGSNSSGSDASTGDGSSEVSSDQGDSSQPSTSDDTDETAPPSISELFSELERSLVEITSVSWYFDERDSDKNTLIIFGEAKNASSINLENIEVSVDFLDREGKRLESPRGRYRVEPCRYYCRKGILAPGEKAPFAIKIEPEVQFERLEIRVVQVDPSDREVIEGVYAIADTFLGVNAEGLSLSSGSFDPSQYYVSGRVINISGSPAPLPPIKNLMVTYYNDNGEVIAITATRLEVPGGPNVRVEKTPPLAPGDSILFSGGDTLKRNWHRTVQGIPEVPTSYRVAIQTEINPFYDQSFQYVASQEGRNLVVPNLEVTMQTKSVCT